MKIIFIVPSLHNSKQMYLEYPLGVGYICTYLKELGIKTKIIDQNAEQCSNLDILNEIEQFYPDIISFSVMTPSYPTAVNQIRMIQKSFKSVPIIAGGIHVAIFGKLLFRDNFDALFTGEGEIDVQKFVIVFKNLRTLLSSNNILINPSTRFPITDHFPIEYKNSIITNNLILNRDVYNLKLYNYHSILTSRGCPYRCKFCCNYSRIFNKNYTRDVESVVSEMKLLETKYNAKEVFFVDDIFFTKDLIIQSFCEEYKKQKLKCQWIAQLRANSINKETILKMKECGCKKICIGVESGSQKILNAANKKLSVNQISSAIKIIKDVGIRIKTFWILGLPGTYSEQRKSIELMLKLMPNEISVHLLIPFPGTDYYEHPERYGIKIKNKFDFESFCYSGLSNNISYEYLSNTEIIKLFEEISTKLEKAGYISSNKYDKTNSKYVYTTPLINNIIKVF